MSIASLSRLISFSIYPKQRKVFTLQFSSTSSADKFFTLLEKKQSNVEKTLALVNAKLDPNCVCEVLKRCSFDISQMGLRFFIWAGLQSNCRYSSYMYNKACEFLKIKQSPFLILDVIEAYKVEKCLVNVKMFKVILNLCKEARIADEALLVLRKVPEFSLRPDITIYNVVIRLFCEKGDMDMANKLMKEIGLIDLYPDMITYFAMIKGFCNAGRLEDACELFQAMREQGFSPNALVYSVLLEGICMHGSTEKALEFLEEMETTGGSCSPNVITYTSVIKSFCEKGHTMEALRILDRMETCGCAPNRVTVITLIKGFCAEGHVEEAYKLIDKVAGRGVSDGDCYSALVVSLIRINRLDEAEILFRKMLASGAKPDGIACSLIIREICRKGRVLDGFCLYDEIEQMRFLSSIDSDIYSILLVGLCQQSHLVEAAKLARSMLDKRIRLKAIYVNKIIEHLKNSGDKELAIQLSRIARELKLIKIYFILLGAVPFPTDVPRLKENGVRGVITLNEPYETLVPTSLYHNYGINHLVIPTRDYYFAPSLTSICQAIDFIHRNVSLGQTTYVHCKAGRGRSTTIVLCYLVYYKQMTPVSAYDYVKLIRPRVRLAASQWQAVEEFYYLKMRKAGFHSYMMDLILRTSDLSPARDLVTFDDGSVVVVTEADLDGYDQSLESGAVGSTIWADLSMVYRVRVVGQAALARISCLWITCQAHQKISAKKLATESSCLGSTISVDIHVY